MIFVATVHWADPKWIWPQRRGLASQLGEPFRVYANLEGIDTQFDGQFDRVTRSGGSHPDKLNDLAEAISRDARASDVLIFLDGDAFPVRPLDTWVTELLSDHPLAAIRRDENAGDIQPHPCFCVTTVGFWRDIAGDWRPGAWVTSEGAQANDTGGMLLATLEERSISWRPILRSNSINLHPVLYGLYEARIYHHGAGFRPPIARVDDRKVAVFDNEEYLVLRTRAHGKSIKDVRPRHVPQLVRLVRDGVGARKLRSYIRSESRRSSQIYDQICADPEFYRRFEGADLGAQSEART